MSICKKNKYGLGFYNTEYLPWRIDVTEGIIFPLRIVILARGENNICKLLSVLYLKKKCASDTKIKPAAGIICNTLEVIMEISKKEYIYLCGFLFFRGKKIKFFPIFCDRDEYITTVVICSGGIHW